MVQEARGLDAGPRFVNQLRCSGDIVSADLVQSIVDDEEHHVAMGLRWFHFMQQSRGLPSRPEFHRLVRKHIPSGLFPPFNELARRAAGMSPEDYIPLVSRKI